MLYLYSERTGEKNGHFSKFSMNFRAAKWKNLVYIRSDGISKCFYATRCTFLQKFERRLSYIAQACVEKYTVLENYSFVVTCCRNDKVQNSHREIPIRLRSR